MVTCTFIDDLASGCVAIVHESGTTYLNSDYGLLNIDVYYFPRLSTDNRRTASGCLMNKSTTKYHVAVFLYVNGIIGDQAIIKNKG